ncbi:MAG: galactokinase [Spirochaetaceae bacterium]|jgi:galactokinase|nr:galactokinase [Spirochaetaceae bacterium]
MAEAALIHCKEYEITDKNERIVIAEAPARLNLMGEYSQAGAGVVLACGIDRSLKVAVSARKDNSLRFYTAETSERKRTSILNYKFKREDRWANHVKLAIYLFSQKGFEPRGMSFTITGNIPQNIGLAAASAVEVASALALRRFYNAAVSDKELIRRLDECHKEFYEGENKLCDFLIIMNARKDSFLIVDEASGEVVKIKNPFPKHKIFILDSRVPFFGASDELRIRREDLDRGLSLLSKKQPAKSFKDFMGQNMIELMTGLEEEARRHSLHVIQELNRIKELETALREGDLAAITRDVFHSHESLRDLYEVSCPEVDWLVKRAQETEGILGARMTGNGFGGCVYIIVEPDKMQNYLDKLEDYERIFGFHPNIYEVLPSAAAKIVSFAAPYGAAP